jgi:hypothetical protein
MGSLTLSELERLAEYDMGHESKERLLTYIGWMWCLLQDLDPAFKTELIRDYGFYLQAQEKEETTA